GLAGRGPPRGPGGRLRSRPGRRHHVGPGARSSREVKYYAMGDIDPQVIQLLKAGKAKEVSYNALASHIISEDGDNPEVGEAREVFDLPVVKPSWVSSEDRSTLWALLTFHGGSCQLNLNRKCTHLVVPEPKGSPQCRKESCGRGLR
ncbi:Hypothetical predicted protein, partial [Marmota monax]